MANSIVSKDFFHSAQYDMKIRFLKVYIYCLLLHDLDQLFHYDI